MRSIDLVAAHLVGDYVLQTNEQAVRKFEDRRARADHVTTYVACFLPVTLVSRAPVGRKLLFLVLLWLAHYATDSRRWASGKEWPPKPILVDQAAHAVQLAVLGRLLG